PGPGLRRWCRLLEVFPVRPTRSGLRISKASTGMRPASPARREGRRRGPQAAGAASGVQKRSVMALNLSQKKEVVAELADVAAKAHSLIAAEYAGTTVDQMTAMRKKARETGVYLKVVKNTLAARAVEGTVY